MHAPSLLAALTAALAAATTAAGFSTANTHALSLRYAV